MRARALGFLLVLGLVVVVVLATRGDGHQYTLKVRLTNAGGLRNGSPVVNGGVPIGDVRLHARRDYVEADLRIKDRYAKSIGRDAVVGIIAQNVVGQKQMRVQPGDPSDRAPDGSWIPAGHVRETTDLDQLLSTLDPDTRVRLAILINETGTAFAGRRMDFSSFLRDFAPALQRGGQVLHELARDNQVLTHLVTNSDGFIQQLAHERRRFTRVLDNAGRVADVVAARRTQLRADAARRPAQPAHHARLPRRPAPHDRPAAGHGQVAHRDRPVAQRRAHPPGPVRAPGRPDATRPAPARPRRAAHRRRRRRPRDPAREDDGQPQGPHGHGDPPAGDVLYGSVDNGVAALDNWAHAIQYRDGMGHIFRGEASFSADLYTSVIGRVTALLPTISGGKARKVRLAPLTPTREGAPAAGSAPSAAPAAAPTNPISAILDQAAAAAGQALPAAQPAAAGRDTTGRLLDFLVGP